MLFSQVLCFISFETDQFCNQTTYVINALKTLVKYMEQRPSKEESQSSSKTIHKILEIKCQQFLL